MLGREEAREAGDHSGKFPVLDVRSPHHGLAAIAKGYAVALAARSSFSRTTFYVQQPQLLCWPRNRCCCGKVSQNRHNRTQIPSQNKLLACCCNTPEPYAKENSTSGNADISSVSSSSDRNWVNRGVSPAIALRCVPSARRTRGRIRAIPGIWGFPQHTILVHLRCARPTCRTVVTAVQRKQDTKGSEQARLLTASSPQPLFWTFLIGKLANPWFGVSSPFCPLPSSLQRLPGSGWLPRFQRTIPPHSSAFSLVHVLKHAFTHAPVFSCV